MYTTGTTMSTPDRGGATDPSSVFDFPPSSLPDIELELIPFTPSLPPNLPPPPIQRYKIVIFSPSHLINLLQSNSILVLSNDVPVDVVIINVFLTLDGLIKVLLQHDSFDPIDPDNEIPTLTGPIIQLQAPFPRPATITVSDTHVFPGPEFDESMV